MTIGTAIWKVFRVCFFAALLFVAGEPQGFWAWVGVIGVCMLLMDVLFEDK